MMTNFTHTDVRKKLQELEGPTRDKYKIREHEGYRESKEVMTNLGRAINGGTRYGKEPEPCEKCGVEDGITGIDPDTLALGLLAGLYQEHRYLQSHLILALITALGNLGEIEGTDARNEFGIGLCREIRELFKDKLFWKDAVAV